MKQNILLLLMLLLLLTLTSCITALTPALLSGGTQPSATPDQVLSYADVFSTTPVSMSTEEGARIIREEFPDLCTNLKFQSSSWNRDKSIQRLEYDSFEAYFIVNSSTGRIDSFRLQRLPDPNLPSMNIAEAQQAAEDFISTHRPDFDLSIMKQTLAETVRNSQFQFEWREFRDDVDIGNAVRIEVDLRGNVLSCSAARNDNLNIDTKAKRITQDEAIAAIKGYLKPILAQERYDALQCDEGGLIVWGNRVAWRIELSAQPEGDPVTYYYWITVDAQTGEVLDDTRG